MMSFTYSKSIWVLDKAEKFSCQQKMIWEHKSVRNKMAAVTKQLFHSNLLLASNSVFEWVFDGIGNPLWYTNKIHMVPKLMRLVLFQNNNLKNQNKSDILSRLNLVKHYRNRTYRTRYRYSNKAYFAGEHFLYFWEIKLFCQTL